MRETGCTSFLRRDFASRSCYLTKVKLFASASLGEIRILPRGTLNLAIRSRRSTRTSRIALSCGVTASYKFRVAVYIERKFVSFSLSLSPSRLAACIFTHSDGTRRNAGRPAPRRFSRSRPVVYFFKHAHAPPCISHAHGAGTRYVLAGGGHRRVTAATPDSIAGTTSLFFARGPTAKIKNVGRSRRQI